MIHARVTISSSDRMAAKDELDRYKTLVSNLENELKSKGRFPHFLLINEIYFLYFLFILQF